MEKLKAYFVKHKSLIKRYGKSTVVSFLAGFLTYLVAAFETIDGWEGIGVSLVTGALFAGVRVIPKALLELMHFSTKE